MSRQRRAAPAVVPGPVGGVGRDVRGLHLWRHVRPGAPGRGRRGEEHEDERGGAHDWSVETEGGCNRGVALRRGEPMLPGAARRSAVRTNRSHPGRRGVIRGWMALECCPERSSHPCSTRVAPIGLPHYPTYCLILKGVSVQPRLVTSPCFPLLAVLLAALHAGCGDLPEPRACSGGSTCSPRILVPVRAVRGQRRSAGRDRGAALDRGQPPRGLPGRREPRRRPGRRRDGVGLAGLGAGRHLRVRPPCPPPVGEPTSPWSFRARATTTSSSRSPTRSASAAPSASSASTSRAPPTPRSSRPCPTSRSTTPAAAPLSPAPPGTASPPS